jgi:hypothetical protein
VPQLAVDAPADLVDHHGNVGIAGQLDLDKAGLETLVRTIDSSMQ